MLSLSPQHVPQHHVASNLRSLVAIPMSELPHGAARAALFTLASAGHDVYAYRSLGSQSHIIWIAPAYPYENGRYTCAEYLEMYRRGEVRGDVAAQ